MTRSNQGFTLLETVMATSLILLMLLTVMSIFTLSGRSPQSSRLAARASVLAESKLEEVRRWAWQKTNGRYNFVSFGNPRLDPYTDQEKPFEEDPSFRYRLEGSWYTQSTGPTTLVRSARRIRVHVTWGGGRGAADMAVDALIGEPPRTLKKLVVRPTQPQTVHVGDSTSFTVQAYDDNDDPIPDLQYEWTVLASTADGRLSSEGESGYVGSGVRFTASALPVNKADGGACKLSVLAIYAGQQQTQTSSTIEVVP